MEVKAYVRGWWDQEIDTVIEYFQSETKQFASVIVSGVYANIPVEDIMLEVRNA